MAETIIEGDSELGGLAVVHPAWANNLIAENKRLREALVETTAAYLYSRDYAPPKWDALGEPWKERARSAARKQLVDDGLPVG